MPRMSKLRIVNLYYDHNKRIIPDITFDFTDKNRMPVDTLIELINGGGKTTIIQMIAQVIKPKQSMQGRTLASFFKSGSSSSRAFILVEWEKDNDLENRILTGIAIRPTESKQDDNDKSKSKADVSYYTFFAEYGVISDFIPYSIDNLELSTNDENGFKVKPYEYIREIAKENRASIRCIREDEKERWSRLLAEYNISQNVWKEIILKINKAETNGLIEYFKGLKSSDALLDDFLVDLIEQKISRDSFDDDEGDSSLSTMLRNYSESLSKKDKYIKDCELLEQLFVEINGLKENANLLSDNFVQYTENMDNAYNFISFLNDKILEIRNKNDELKSNLNYLDACISDIEHEKKSDAYYIAKDDFDKKNAEYEDAKSKKAEIDNIIKNLEKEEHAYMCSELSLNIDAENGIKNGLLEKKRAIEENSDYKNKINSLKYSIKLGLGSDIDDTENLLNKALTEESDLEHSISTLNANKEKSEKAFKITEEQVMSSRSDLNSKMKETEKKVSALLECVEDKKLHFQRMAHGFYVLDDVLNCKNYIENKHNETIKNIKKISQYSLRYLENKKNEITEKKYKLLSSIPAIESGKAKYKEELDNYYKIYSELQNICSDLELPQSFIFNEKLEERVNLRIDKIKTKIEHLNKVLNAQEEKLRKAEEGSLHVPSEILSYVQDLGVDFQTGENYIYNLYKSGSLDEKKMDQLLNEYPFLAYSLIFNSSDDIDKIFEEKNEDWLPSLVPLFNYEQFSQMLSEEFKSGDFLANYDNMYFFDRDNYLSSISNDIDTNQSAISELKNQLDNLYSYRKVIESFDYDSRSENALISEIEKCDSDLASLQDSVKECDKKVEECNNKIGALNKELLDAQKKASKLEDNIKLAIEITDCLTEEDELNAIYQDSYVENNRIKQKLSSYESELKNCNEKHNDISRNISSYKENLDEMKRKYEAFKDAQNFEIIESSWEELLSEYNILTSSLDSDISDIDNKIMSSDKKINKMSDEIRNLQKLYDIQHSDYSSLIFSDEALSSIRNQIHEKKKESVDIYEHYDEINANRAAAETELKNKEKALSDDGLSVLPRNKIGYDFDNRIREFQKEKEEIDDLRNKLSASCIEYDVIVKSANSNILKGYQPVNISTFTIENDLEIDKYWEDLSGDIKKSFNDFRRIKYGLINLFKDVVNNEKYREKTDIINTLNVSFSYIDKEDGILLSDVKKCNDGIDRLVDSIEKLISAYKSRLAELSNDFDNLVEHCLKQAEIIYDDLKKIASVSKVNIFEDKPPVQLIRIGLADKKTFSDEMARNNIIDELKRGSDEIKDMFINGTEPKKISEKVKSIVKGNNLLHRYTNQNTIPVDLFKIEIIKEQSQYIRFENCLSNNSGGESFVSLFAIILGAIYYVRSSEGISNKDVSSVIPLDNPFGDTNAEHLLKPLFRMANNFNVQLLCFTGHREGNISRRFRNIIQLEVREQSVGKLGILNLKNQERINTDPAGYLEQAFYKNTHLIKD